ncbi:hypothetical protein V8E53_014314 [Lactarius tabidus]
MVRLSALGFALAAASVLVPGVLSQVPACAQTCATSAASSSSCTATDITCLCNSQAFQNAAQTCVETTCSSTDSAAAINYFEGLCGASSSTLSSDISTGTTRTTTSPSSTRSSTSPTTSTTTSSTSKPNHATRDQPAGVLGAGLALALALFA